MKLPTWKVTFHAATFAAAMCAVIAAVVEQRDLTISAAILTAMFTVLSAYAGFFDTNASLSQLQQHFASRELIPTQRKALIEALQGRGLHIELDWSQSRESASYAAQLRSAFEQGGCVVSSNGAIYPVDAYWGLLGPGIDFRSTEARCIHDAFHAAGIRLRPVLDLTAKTRIVVGTKPPMKRPAPPEQPISGVRPNPPFED